MMLRSWITVMAATMLRIVMLMRSNCGSKKIRVGMEDAGMEGLLVPTLFPLHARPVALTSAKAMIVLCFRQPLVVLDFALLMSVT